MSVKKTECCNMHTKEKEESGTCCQTKENAEQQTYEYSVKIGPEPKEQK